MKTRICEIGNNKYLELTSAAGLFASEDQWRDVLEHCMGEGIYIIEVPSEFISPDFFRLRTRIAGEVLQKFTQYAVRMVITGDFSDIESESLSAFIAESNRQGRIMFVADINEVPPKFFED